MFPHWDSKIVIFYDLIMCQGRQSLLFYMGSNPRQQGLPRQGYNIQGNDGTFSK